MTPRQWRNARRFFVATVFETFTWMVGVTKENTSGTDPGESEWLVS
jgi:hypothetical protein